MQPRDDSSPLTFNHVAAFDPGRSPVTLLVARTAGAHWRHVLSTARNLSGQQIPVTVCRQDATQTPSTAEIAAQLAAAGCDMQHVTLQDPARFQPDVIARCPLLAPEYGQYPWSEQRIMCPAETAWVPLSVSLQDFAGDHALGAELDRLVDAAEHIHDAARWPTVRMQQDAWLNRRVAIQLTDIGAYAEGRTAAQVHRRVGWVSARLQARSRDWARRRRPLPAIRDRNPARHMRPSAVRDQWFARWSEAVTATAVRHRNLLVMSPYAMLRADPARRCELLPLLIHADAVCLAGPGSGQDHAAPCQQAFHRALNLALQQRHALDQIAKHV